MFERLDEGGVAKLNIFASAFGSPSVPSRSTAEGGSGTSAFAISCLPRKSARLGSLGGGGGGNDGGGGGRLGALGWFAVGGGGGAEGFGGTCVAFGIGGADGGGLEKPSELTDGDTATERDFGVDGTLLEDELDDELGSAGGLKYAGASGSKPG